MGKKNLKAQLMYAINSCFQGNKNMSGGFGASKHSDKRTNQKNGKIYSYSSLHSRTDVACMFASFIKENYPEIKNASDLTPEVAEAFLLSKAAACTTETLDCYRSNLSALAENINRTYSSAHVSLKVDKVVGVNSNQETRCKPMESSQISALKNSYKPGSTGYKAVTLAELAGLRASEIVRVKSKDIRIENRNKAIVFVHKGKGGRNREVTVRDPQSVAALRDLKESILDDQRIVEAKSGSIQKSINRHMKKIEGSSGRSLKDEFTMSGFHSIRKCWAQKEYDRCREEDGMTRQEALDYVSQQLGHGKERDLATLQRYIANIW